MTSSTQLGSRSGRRVLVPIAFGVLGIALLLAAWQWGSIQIASESALPGVPVVTQALVALITQGSFWAEAGTTLSIALFGWIVAAAIGVALGVLVGTSEIAHAATRVVLEFLRPIPAIVILPLAMLVLGPTTEMGVFLVIFGIMLPIAAQTAAGVESVDPVMVNTARSFGLRPGEILWRVILPGASPYIGTAMRVAAPVTLIMAVVAGMLGGAPGLGNSLTVAQIAGRNEDIFAYVIVLGCMGLLVQAAAARAERRILHWHSSYRKES
ncbi:ABC-type nitrate/sulfonate/bicarbonate transport system permease component [Leucobacter luti]|uniref:ABC transporter permease n=1 Tax=Leucobacter luti TaxID=340320 RepID=UPI00104FDD01|nr:ABC transporter permease [Leucobacter luti]MCW2288950.1 ABC-type nitrate/sulfonate/bicarbonate transport system permease component [Leucobacter luti]TCK44900.1 ABC-type nitrate/sulfonate/bicarbonate transport system permease component [Leucobacter luti]